MLGQVLCGSEGVPAPVTINSVELRHPNHLQLIDALVLDIRGQTLVGSANTWPPPSDTVEHVWASRRSASGAVLEAHEVLNLVIHIKSTAMMGRTLEGINVGYTVGRRTYRAATTMKFIIKRECRS